MPAVKSKQLLSSVCAGFVAGVVLVVAGGMARAESLSEDQIINALKPKGLTRSMGAPAPTARSADEDQFLDTVRKKRTRGLSLNAREREKVSEIKHDKPKIDMSDIQFEYNSAQLSPDALPTIDKLGRALSSSSLSGSVFLLSGHTDGKGGEDYNQGLSERRAEAVRKYLMERFRLKPDNLMTAGYGKKELKNPNDPFAAENRRVEIVNMKDN